MSEPEAERAAGQPGASWRTAAFAGAGMAVILGAAILVVAVVVPVLHTRNVVTDLHAKRNEADLNTTKPSGPPWPHWDEETEKKALKDLGGPEGALGPLRTYVHLPEWAAPHRSAAVQLLGRCGEGAVPSLVGAVGKGDEDSRLLAMVALARFEKLGPEAEAALPALFRVIGGSEHWNRRACAARVLRKIGPGAVPFLVEALGNPDAQMRRKAALALQELGPAAESAVPALTSSLEDSDPVVRSWAAEALGRIGPAAKGSIPDLVELLGHADERVRAAAAESLGRMGSTAREAAPALEAALRGESEFARAAHEALQKIRGPE